MQVTTTRPLVKRTVSMLAIVGVVAAAALAIMVVATTGQIPGMSQRNAVSEIAPQASADAAYTTESELANENARRAQAARWQMTSDTAFALEASQLTRQYAAQAARLSITSDQAYASEAALMAEQARHIVGARVPSWTLGFDLTPRQ